MRVVDSVHCCNGGASELRSLSLLTVVGYAVVQTRKIRTIRRGTTQDNLRSIRQNREHSRHIQHMN